MSKRLIKTIYPLKIEKSYSNNISELVNELDNLINYEFENVISPAILSQKLVSDVLKEDSAIDRVKKAINKIEALALGAFPNLLSKRAAKKFVNGVNANNLNSINIQLRRMNTNPIDQEKWLKPFLDIKVEENVSYITSIRDSHVKNVEQIILRGVTNGQSTTEMAEEIKKQKEISLNKAQFIARDQTGTLLGKMTAERHKRAGIIAFRWSDSGDSKVRHSHAVRNGKIFFYEDNPLLPGEDYGCRCVAEMADEFDDDFLQALEERNRPVVKKAKPVYNRVTEKEYYDLIEKAGNATYSQEIILYDRDTGYIQTPVSFEINNSIRAGTINKKSAEWQRTVKTLDKVIENNRLTQNVEVIRYDNEPMLQKLFEQNNLLGSDFNSIMEYFKSGLGRFNNPSYVSTSLIYDKNVFLNRKVRTIIKVPEGKKVFVTKNVIESEMILPRDTNFKVLDFNFTEKGIEIIMEVI